MYFLMQCGEDESSHKPLVPALGLTEVEKNHQGWDGCLVVSVCTNKGSETL